MTAPAAGAATAAGGSLVVRWSTEGVPADRLVKIALHHGENDVTTLALVPNSGEATVGLPGADFLQTYTNVRQAASAGDFRVRLDAAHAADEGDGAWADQLFAYSQPFEISGL